MHPVVVSASRTESALIDPLWPSWAHLAAYSVLYFAAAAIGQWPSLAPGLTATLWTPGGLSLALLLLIDKRHWGRFAAAAFCADVAAELYFYEFGFAAAIAVALGNVLEALTGAALIRWCCGTPFHLRCVRDVLAMALFGGVLSPTIGATIGAATLSMTGVQDFRPAWLLWWLGDSLGVLVIAPLVIASVQGKANETLTTWRICEAIALLAVLVGTAHFFLTNRVPVSFVMLPPLLWAALRFGVRGASLALALLSTMTLIYVAAGFEVFARFGFSKFWETVFMQTFLGVASVSTLVLAALTEQRDQAAQELRALANVLDRRVNEQTSALRKSEELLALALESAGAAEWSWDIVQNRLSWSPRYRALYGFAENEPGDLRTWLGRVHPDDLERLERRISTMLATPGDDIWQEEFRIVHPTRGILWVGGSGRVKRDKNGAALQITGINYDITEHRRSEAQLRLHQVAHARLSRLGAVASLTAGLAHEINQPLMAARTYARLTAQSLGLAKPVISEARSSAESAVAQVERAAEVVRRLRDFLQFGRSSTQAIRLAPVVESALTLMQPEIERAGIAIRKEIDGNLPMVMADAIQIEQVLINLLRNSIEALRETSDRKGNVSIKCRRSGKHLEVCVSDNGPGFLPEAQPFPPQPFMTTKPDGLGFGLSFSRSIIEAHRGRLWVGRNGPGAAVYFTLPLAEQDPS